MDRLFPSLPPIVLLGALFVAVLMVAYPFAMRFLGVKAAKPPEAKGGDVSVAGDFSAGHGEAQPGGHVEIAGGAGYHGASGGDVDIGPGKYTAGNAGAGGSGGNLTIRGGDAKPKGDNE